MSDLDLFNNPALRDAFNSLPKEEQERYKKIGEEMYNTIKFEECQIMNNMTAPMDEAVAYILESLKSGLHPSELDENEKKILEDVCGSDWYISHGYVKEDLTEIVTVKKE